MENIDRKFKDCLDLHRLKYFTLDDLGRLVINRDEVGPVIDFHTHLGMTFAFGPRLPLASKTAKIDYFFPYRDAPVNLDVYAAQCFSEKDADKTRFECARAVWSGKGFMGTHTVPNLLEDMDRIGVTHAVLHAIDFPLISNNTRQFTKATEDEPRLIVFGSVHPYSTGLEKKVDRMIQMGCVGMKMHPAQQFYTAANKRARLIYEICEQRRLPALFHTGDSDIAPKMSWGYPAIKHFREPVADFPDLTFIFGHAGIHQYQEGIELAKKHDNIYMEISGQPPHRIKEMIDGIGAERVLFGSDWAFYAIEFPLAKALIATEGNPDAREKVLYKNAQRLLKQIGGIEN